MSKWKKQERNCGLEESRISFHVCYQKLLVIGILGKETLNTWDFWARLLKELSQDAIAFL